MLDKFPAKIFLLSDNDTFEVALSKGPNWPHIDVNARREILESSKKLVDLTDFEIDYTLPNAAKLKDFKKLRISKKMKDTTSGMTFIYARPTNLTSENLTVRIFLIDKDEDIDAIDIDDENRYFETTLNIDTATDAKKVPIITFPEITFSPPPFKSSGRIKVNYCYVKKRKFHPNIPSQFLIFGTFSKN